MRSSLFALLLCLPMTCSGQSIRYYPNGSESPALGGDGSIRYYPPGVDWYVDSVGGDDANDGRSASSAFETIAALVSAGISAGQSIGLARGSVWREELPIGANSVAVAAYGSGARPILDASDIVAAGDWSKAGGFTNVYQATVALGVTGGWVNVWEDGEFLSRAASSAACDASAGSYFPSTEASSPITLYIHPSDSSDPTSSGKVYEYSRRGQGIAASGRSNVTIRGIHTKRNLGQNGSIDVGNFARVYDTLVEDGNKHNILVGAGSYLEDVTASRAYFGASGAAAYFVHYVASGAGGLGVTYVRCTAEDDTQRSTYTGFYGHSGDASSFGAVVCNQCRGDNIGSVFNWIAADSVTLTNCSSDLTVGVTSLVAPSVTVSGGTFTVINGRPPFAVGAHLSMTGVDVSGAGTWYQVYTSANSPSLTVTDTTFRTQYAIQATGTGVNLTSLRNTFTSTGWVYNLGNNAIGSLSSDYNSFAGAGSYFKHSGTDWLSLAAYRAANPTQDLHSTP